MFALLLELPYEPSCHGLAGRLVCRLVGPLVGALVDPLVGWSLGWSVGQSLFLKRKGREIVLPLHLFHYVVTLNIFSLGTFWSFVLKQPTLRKQCHAFLASFFSYFGENKILMDIQYIQYIYMPWGWAKELMGIKKVIFLTQKERKRSNEMLRFWKIYDTSAGFKITAWLILLHKHKRAYISVFLIWPQVLQDEWTFNFISF